MFGLTLVSTARLQSMEEQIADLDIAHKKLTVKLERLESHQASKSINISLLGLRLKDLEENSMVRTHKAPVCQPSCPAQHSMDKWEWQYNVLQTELRGVRDTLRSVQRHRENFRGVDIEMYRILSIKCVALESNIKRINIDIAKHNKCRPLRLNTPVFVQHRKTGCIGIYKVGSDRISIIRKGVGGCLDIGDIVYTTQIQLDTYWDIRTDNLQVVVNV